MSDTVSLSCGSTFSWSVGSEGSRRWVEFVVDGEAGPMAKRIVWQDGDMEAAGLLYTLSSVFSIAWRELVRSKDRDVGQEGGA